MHSTPTARANALAIPLGHRDEDALEASKAAHLFDLDRRYRTNPQNHALAGLEWIRGWGKDRRHKRLTKIYDFLGSRVFDDGWALASTREIAKETKTDAKQIRRDLAELAKAGLLRTATWGGSWKRRKASAHYLVPFGAMLDKQKMRRGERPQIRELIESVPTQVSPRAEPRAAESVPTSSSGEDSLRISSRANALNGPDKAKIRNRPRSEPGTARPAADKESLRRQDPQPTAKTPPIIPDLAWERRRRLELLYRYGPQTSEQQRTNIIKLERYRALWGLA